MAKRKAKKGLSAAVASIVVLLIAICVGYFFLDKKYGNDKNEETTKVVTTTESVIQNDSPYVTLTNGKYSGVTIYKVYKDVFEGNASIITEAGEFKLEEYINCENESINEFDTNLKVKAYASVDLDGDFTEDIILQLDMGDDSLYAILHYSNGYVYGYKYIVGRGMQMLKTDGSFVQSSGASDNVWTKIVFDNSSMKYDVLASTVSAGENIEYSIGDEKVDKDKFDEFEKSFNKKADASFIDIN